MSDFEKFKEEIPSKEKFDSSLIYRRISEKFLTKPFTHVPESTCSRSTFNKTFYTCSRKSLLWSYNKSFKEVAKLGSFIQCSVYIFLGHDGCV